MRVSAAPNKLLSLNIHTHSFTQHQQTLTCLQNNNTHTHTIFLRNDKHFSPTADWHSDNLPFHITLLRWLRCKQDIAPKRTDGEADRPTDMGGDDVSNKSIMIWAMLMLWHSASPLPRDLGDDVKAGGARTPEARSLNKWAVTQWRPSKSKAVSPEWLKAAK